MVRKLLLGLILAAPSVTLAAQVSPLRVDAASGTSATELAAMLNPISTDVCVGTSADNMCLDEGGVNYTYDDVDADTNDTLLGVGGARIIGTAKE